MAGEGEWRRSENKISSIYRFSSGHQNNITNKYAVQCGMDTLS
jgi:hypothetical protein